MRDGICHHQSEILSFLLGKDGTIEYRTDKKTDKKIDCVSLPTDSDQVTSRPDTNSFGTSSNSSSSRASDGTWIDRGTI